MSLFSDRQASLRYRELNESLETVHKKLGDARVYYNTILTYSVLFNINFNIHISVRWTPRKALANRNELRSLKG